MSYKITRISARQILDSRGNPTIETTVWAGKSYAIASVPSGASTGTHEALELRDGKKSYNGLSVNTAIRNVEKVIAPLLTGLDVREQEKLDAAMIKKDGTPNKSKLGANAILSVSLASARLAAELAGKPLYVYLSSLGGYGRQPWRLPTPLLNVLNGGVHADSGLDIQEFFIIPKRGSFAQKMEMAHAVISTLKSALVKKNFTVSVGDEGGFAPKLHSNEKALRFLREAVAKNNLHLGKDIALGMDAAASEFFDAEKSVYRLTADNKHFKPASMYQLYARWIKQYKLEIIEDGCAEDDMLGWQKLTIELGAHTLLVGDDLFVTQTGRLQSGIIAGIANSVLIKLNQVGTLTETLATIALAKKYNYKTVISHRSGETTDDFIADLAVATRADFIKAGSLNRSERLAKYNRLLKIEEELK